VPLFSHKRVSSITKADVARAAGDYNEAAGYYAEALTRNPARPEIWVQYAHALKESGRHLDAEAAYRRAIEGDPVSADAHLHLGHLLGLQRRGEEAKLAYLQAVALDPALIDARRALTDLGLDEAQIATSCDVLPPLPVPRRRPSLITRADRAREVCQWAEAARLYREALGRNPRNAPIWVQYGHVLRQIGDLPAAESAYRRALTFDPRNADTHQQLGHALKLQGKTGEAQSAYLRAYALDPLSPYSLEELAGLEWSNAEIAELSPPLDNDEVLPQWTVPPHVEHEPSDEDQSIIRAATDARTAPPSATAAEISCLKEPILREETALFVTHSPNGRVKPHVGHYLESLRRHGIAVILIVVADMPFTVDDADFMDSVDGLFVRQNQGFDFSAWAHVLRLYEKIFTVDILYLLNDSIIGPTNDKDFVAILDSVRSSTAALVGLTENYERGWHISSYFLAVKRKGLASSIFYEFMQSIVSYDDKEDVINSFEVRLAPLLESAGLKCEALFPAIDCFNLTIFHWKYLIESGFPFLKVMTIRDAIPDVDTSDWRDVLGKQGYDVSLAERTLAQAKRSGPAPVRQPTDGEAAAGGAEDLEDDPAIKLFLDIPRVVDGRAASAVQDSLMVEGWALARDGVASIEVSIDGRAFGSARCGVPRGDVAQAFPDWEDSDRSGYTFPLVMRKGIEIGKHTVRITLHTKTGRSKAIEFEVLFRSEQLTLAVTELRRKVPRSELDLTENVLAGFGSRPQFGVVLAVGEFDDEAAFTTTLLSIRDQAYSAWRAAIISKGPALPDWVKRRLATGFADLSDRICLCASDDGEDFVDAVTRANGERHQDLITVVSPGDVLACDALLQMAVSAGMNRDADFFYSDERRTNPASREVEAFFKPQWSPALLLSTNYIGRLWCARPDLIRRAGTTVGHWLRFGEYDLILRCTELARRVQHVPRLLCERGTPQIEPPAREREALARAMDRRHIEGALTSGCAPGYYRMTPTQRSAGLVSIIIPTCGAGGLVKTCIESIRRLTAYRDIEIVVVDDVPADDAGMKSWLHANADVVVRSEPPFNWSRYNNRGVRRAQGKYLVFLNDDIEITEPGWLDSLIAHAERPEVGIVGARLLYPDGRVQHAGMFWAAGAMAGRHSFRFVARSDPGYFGLAMTTRNVIMVTGACMMVRREWFEAIGGFDEAHSIVNNDVDFCMRSWEAGKLTVYEPAATLIHHEAVSRHTLSEDYDADGFWTKWGKLIAAGDPYYHPNLSREGENYAAEREPIQLLTAGHPLLSVAEIRRILVVKLDHIGDFITSIPAMKKLAAHFPQAELYLMTSPTNRALADLMPRVKEVIELEFFFPRSELARQRELSDDDLAALEQKLKPYHFDLAIDLRMHFQTRKILRYTGAKWRAGYDTNNLFPWLDIAVEQEADVTLLSKRSQIGDDLCRLVDAVILATDRERSTLRLQNGNPPTGLARSGRPLVCIHPGVGDPTRRWPPGHFGALIDLLVSNHDVEIALIGSPDEAETASEVLDNVVDKAAVQWLVGTTPLAEIPALLASAVLFVGNNSGPNHVAAGLGIPAIGVYSGVVDARQWGAMGPNAVVLQRQMHCSPCYIGKTADCPRGMACVTELLPEDVYRVCQRMLAIKATAAPDPRKPEQRP
jgi:ADP-heptose:LPS heptosyltransferase/GT2 family glycosyltransferase/tetratricopeptide (TPR) repeat protein